MDQEVKIVELPSYRVAAVGGRVGPTTHVCKDSQSIGERLLHWAERAGVGRDMVPELKGLALLSTDWEDYARRSDRFHPEVKACTEQVMDFVQCLPLEQGVVEFDHLVERYGADGAAAEVGLQILHTPGGLYAVARDEGPYHHRTGLRTVFLWLEESEFRLDWRPVIELYLNDPGTTSELHLLTDVCVPVKRDQKGFKAETGILRFF